MRTTPLSILLALLILVGCGTVVQTTSPATSSSTGGTQPPKVSVTIGGQGILARINGYQWSNGTHTEVADVANDPAKHLTLYRASVGQTARLSFNQNPKRTEPTVWSNGKQVSKSTLNGSSFVLPTQVGDYIYEITGHWENNDVKYDFEVQVHS